MTIVVSVLSSVPDADQHTNSKSCEYKCSAGPSSFFVPLDPRVDWAGLWQGWSGIIISNLDMSIAVLLSTPDFPGKGDNFV